MFENFLLDLVVRRLEVILVRVIFWSDEVRGRFKWDWRRESVDNVEIILEEFGSERVER